MLYAADLSHNAAAHMMLHGAGTLVIVAEILLGEVKPGEAAGGGDDIHAEIAELRARQHHGAKLWQQGQSGDCHIRHLCLVGDVHLGDAIVDGELNDIFSAEWQCWVACKQHPAFANHILGVCHHHCSVCPNNKSGNAHMPAAQCSDSQARVPARQRTTIFRRCTCCVTCIGSELQCRHTKE